MTRLHHFRRNALDRRPAGLWRPSCTISPAACHHGSRSPWPPASIAQNKRPRQKGPCRLRTARTITESHSVGVRPC